MKYKVPIETLETLRALRETQHNNVRAIGEAVIERRVVLTKVAELGISGDELHTRIGVIQVEYERALGVFFAAVDRTQEEQRVTGDTALVALGLVGDVQYRIDEETGVVSRFISGAQPCWVEDF